MKRSWKVILLLLLLIGMRFQGIQSAAAASELEEFMRRFEPDYEIPYFEFAGGMDTKNEFAQPVRLMQTTGKGVVLRFSSASSRSDEGVPVAVETLASESVVVVKRLFQSVFLHPNPE